MTFTIGDTLGPYRIIEQIGQGGMATVYKAYHANLDRYVAVKVLHPAFKEDPSFFERFKREAQIVAKLEHPAIIPVYDYADKDGQPYLVMKFIEGETLKARLKRKPLTLTETITIFESVATGLTYAHNHGILHRDIKPSNIMLDKDGTPYIADFGLARIAQAGESTLSQDMMLGTPQYISPEQAQGVRDLGPSTDVYSLGIVLYEIIVGKVPFSADTPFAIIHDHIYKPLPIPTQLNPDVPPQIEKVLLKALSKMPQDRFQSAVELVAAFRQAVEEAGLTELSVARYRAVVHSEAPTSATVPPITPSPTPTPAYVGVPSVMATQSITDSAARRAARRRRRHLWFLGGIGSLLLICLTSLFILVRALSDPDLRPWDTSNVEARDPDENAVPSDGEPPVVPPMRDRLADMQTGFANDPANAFNRLAQGLDETGATSEQVAQLGSYAEAQGFTEMAIWLYFTALNTKPVDPAVRNEAGAYLYHTALDSPAAMLAAAQIYNEQQPDSATVQTILALAVIQTEPERALVRRQAGNYLNNAIEAESLPETYLVRGLYYQFENDMAKARDDWQTAADFADAPQWVVDEANRLLNQE